jgi:2-phospho-L-lactate guanylyltransferase
MASSVVAAAHELPVLIVYDDPAVGVWATRVGANSIAATEPGLNAAVDAGREHLIEQGLDRVIIAHADLPHATDLRPVGEFDGITLVPDRAGDGTNVLCVPSDVDFTFCYGPSSFATHLRRAKATGRDVRVFNDPRLAWDVDHPDDLGPFIAADVLGEEGRAKEGSDVNARP